MSAAFPPQDLTCPDPGGCPVAVDALTALAARGAIPCATIRSGAVWHRVYDAVDGYHQPNPGFGDTRFAPFDAQVTGERVPTLYLAESFAAALLETVFHDVAEQDPRVVDEQMLRGRLHAAVLTPEDIVVADLRDPALGALGIDRAAVSASSAEHYPCTRRVARGIHAMASAPQGVLWHSRQTELNGRPAAEVVVVFADRLPLRRGTWPLAPQMHASGSLVDGFGRQGLDVLAEELGVTVLTRRSL